MFRADSKSNLLPFMSLTAINSLNKQLVLKVLVLSYYYFVDFALSFGFSGKSEDLEFSSISQISIRLKSRIGGLFLPLAFWVETKVSSYLFEIANKGWR